jgi:hypothetical protein
MALLGLNCRADPLVRTESVAANLRASRLENRLMLASLYTGRWREGDTLAREMKQFRTGLLIYLAMLGVFAASAKISSPLEGRWDLTVKTSNETYPSWLEFTERNGQPFVRVQGRVSSVHPVQDLKLDGPHMTFTSSEWFGKPTKVSWEFTVNSGKLTGTQTREDGTQGEITGVPAPPLKRKPPSAWSQPETLFNGKDLSGWEPDDPAKNHWKAEDGDLVNVSPGANLRTVPKFQDFKLHIEYNCPKDGNSGIYLRGRYEVQVAYEAANDRFHGMGAIYGFLAPQPQLPDKPGQWETFDITLIGRYVTVIRDGVLTIANKEIPGITGGALDSDEAEPNSLYIQGDHTGGMKYRNIRIAIPAQ